MRYITALLQEGNFFLSQATTCFKTEYEQKTNCFQVFIVVKISYTPSASALR